MIFKKKQELSEEDLPLRRDHGNTWLGLLALALVIVFLVTGVSAPALGSSMTAESTVRTATAQFGDIAGIFSGSGTLKSSEAEALELPASVKILSCAVKNGDILEAGDTIARVDKTSVQKAIYEIQTLIGQMDEEMNELQDEALPDEITARAEGRIKAIYVSPGDRVAEVMDEQGALLLLSLGGSMTAVIETDAALTVGQVLTVTLSGGEEIEGKVQQLRGGTATVTTSDQLPTPGEAATFSLPEGEVLGTGTLEVSSPLRVTGYFGTVDRVKAEVGDRVEIGDTLVTLTDTADLSRYHQLLRERRELEAQLSSLNAMYREGAIKAPSAGIVSQLDSDISYVPLASATGWQIQLLSNLEIPPLPLPTPEVHPDGVYAGLVTRVSYGALHIRISELDMTGTTPDALATLDEALFTKDTIYTPDPNLPVFLYQEGLSIPAAVDALQADDKVLLTVTEGVITRIDYQLGLTLPEILPELPDFSYPMPDFGGYDYSLPESQPEAPAEYKVEKTTLCAIAPGETMTAQIPVDERDILSLSPGQEAAITLDALPGQSFHGVVKKLSPQGTNQGGSTKYTMTLEIPRQPQMLDGMNVSAVIEVSRLADVLTLPAEAVYEEGTRAYVYTGLDVETGAPTDPVPVTAGTSDGTSIEILTGLTPGATVYYEYADSIRYE